MKNNKTIAVNKAGLKAQPLALKDSLTMRRCRLRKEVLADNGWGHALTHTLKPPSPRRLKEQTGHTPKSLTCSIA